MADGCVYILGSTVAAINALDIGDFNRCTSWEQMAELLYILKELPDDEVTFPHGKRATIQEIERQVRENAQARAQNIVHKKQKKKNNKAFDIPRPPENWGKSPQKSESRDGKISFGRWEPTR